MHVKPACKTKTPAYLYVAVRLIPYFESIIAIVADYIF